eukprot:CAMPEP_0202916426 /NCGR_PEP_ID=MMETSP1392-20130828/68558_1 /ASSEMBLY_ACC=CAM_ASM_000868 /TAXON_ID=225041 /ORGANISM="Chlamydomonas chlamydogama, Strain SAG 11-48b" /LENGTH=40 /DNA_ID= /DNA_START= /DNA_END= /DNA_ORIENTATION=
MTTWQPPMHAYPFYQPHAPRLLAPAVTTSATSCFALPVLP